jgi:hypothetical protein
MILTNYLNQFDIIDKRQFAYQKEKGVNKLFCELSDYINTNLSSKKHTIGIAVDYSKAFDVLDHGILLKKLEKIGISYVLRLIVGPRAISGCSTA